MSQFELGESQSRPYGIRRTGAVTYAKAAVEVYVREPGEDIEPSGITWVLAPGLTEDPAALRLAAIEATKLGHKAVILAHLTKGIFNALDNNANDVAAVVDALPSDTEVAIMGHSKGGATAIRGARRARRPVRQITTVAPAHHLLERFYTRENILHGIWDARHEPLSLEGDSLTAKAIKTSTAKHCLRRPLAVGAEFLALIRGSVHDEVHALKSESNNTYLLIAYGDDDRLYPLRAMEESIVDLPYDDQMCYEGGHCRINYDADFARMLFLRGRQGPRVIPNQLAA
ncbi:MAG TPA: hypothetical protein VLF40_01015 [Candidatus Saccharimonadales bacterium]|nr:hypothetical protein [Candidatus Saccharimonadales bacterium]